VLRVPQLEDYITVVDYVLSAEDPADGGDPRPLGPNAWLFAAPVGVEPRPDAVARLAASLPDATTFAGYVVNASSEAAYLAQPPHAAVDRGAFVRSRADVGARAETRRWFWGTPRTLRNARSTVASNSFPAVSEGTGRFGGIPHG